jgi:hypothetical protein
MGGVALKNVLHIRKHQLLLVFSNKVICGLTLLSWPSSSSLRLSSIKCEVIML